MFERFTESARRALFFARYEVSQRGGYVLDTEHLLLGVLREGSGIMPRLLALANAPVAALRRDIDARPVSEEQVSTSVEVPFSAGAQRALQLAGEEADRLLHNYIGTEHLLLGLLRCDGSTAATVLANRGLRLAAVREALVTLLGEAPAGSEPGRPPQIERLKQMVEQLAQLRDQPYLAQALVDDIKAKLDELQRQLG